MTCATCAAEIAPSLLACPSCHALMHAARLKELARQAEAAASAGDVSGELATWREAVALLPPGTKQHDHLRGRIAALGRELLEPMAPTHADTTARTGAGQAGWKAGGLIGGALLLWKFKAVVAFVLTKGKLLALGLTNSTTLLSMLPSLGVYWLAFGWQFGAGLIASIYVHEMGHVASLTRFGVAASAPMFLPGVGAVIRGRQVIGDPRQQARIGLAGPIWGLGASLAAFGLYAATGTPIWAAIGQVGAWINLFNLAPVWQLDGAHGFAAMNRRERWLVVLAAVALLAWTRQGLLVIVAALGVLKALRDDAPADGDGVIVVQFVGLLASLAWLAGVEHAPR